MLKCYCRYLVTSITTLATTLLSLLGSTRRWRSTKLSFSCSKPATRPGWKFPSISMIFGYSQYNYQTLSSLQLAMTTCRILQYPVLILDTTSIISNIDIENYIYNIYQILLLDILP